MILLPCNPYSSLSIGSPLSGVVHRTCRRRHSLRKFRGRTTFETNRFSVDAHEMQRRFPAILTVHMLALNSDGRGHITGPFGEEGETNY